MAMHAHTHIHEPLIKVILNIKNEEGAMPINVTCVTFDLFKLQLWNFILMGPIPLAIHHLLSFSALAD